MDIDEPPGKKLTKKVREMEWKLTSEFVKVKKCTPEAHILLAIQEKANQLLIFEEPTNLNELVKHICDQTNLYATQKGSDFALNPKQICIFLGINYIMSISKLPSMKCDDD